MADQERTSSAKTARPMKVGDVLRHTLGHGPFSAPPEYRVASVKGDEARVEWVRSDGEPILQESALVPAECHKWHHEDGTPVSPPAKPEVKEFTMTVNIRGAGPDFTPIWVVKFADGRYLRASNLGGVVCVKERRLATRFDSATWAATLAGSFAAKDGARPVRLYSKPERELKKMVGTTWKYPDKAVAAPVEKEDSNAR